MLNQSYVGLDIGTKKVKIVKMKNSNILSISSFFVPEKVMENETIVDPETLGVELGKVTKELGIKNGKTIVSIGNQLYSKIIEMPQLKKKELREATIYQALKSFPIHLEDIEIDVCPVRKIKSGTETKIEVLAVAAPAKHLVEIETICKIANLDLIAIEPEPVALYRILGSQSDITEGILNIGGSRSLFSIYKKGILHSVRAIQFGCSAFYQNNDNVDTLEQVDAEDPANLLLIKDIATSLSRSLEYFKVQESEEIEKITICGGGAKLKNIDKFLKKELGLNVDKASYESKVSLRPSVHKGLGDESLQDFVVAIGLAMRKKV